MNITRHCSRVHSIVLLWICLHEGCKELDNLLRYKVSQSMNYESFAKLLRVDLQLRTRGWLELELCHRSRPESRLTSDCSHESRFVDSFDFVLFCYRSEIAEQNCCSVIAR